jgi:hypothetical protein
MEEKDEKVVEETTQETSQQDSGDENVVQVDESKFESAGDDDVIKVDLSKPPVTQEDKVEETVAEEKVEETVTEVTSDTEAQPEVKTQETPVLEEITEDEVEEIAAEVEEAITESMETGNPLPENIQKLMDFMEETGGDLSDYVKLNQDYSTLNDEALLREYYTQTKPHLDTEEISFLMEDQFSYEEDVDDDRDIRKKKIALKEQVASAKSHLDGQKSKYYDEIKAGSKLTGDQQKAIDFFDRYNKETEELSKSSEINRNNFTQKTEQVFNDKFKGFEYNVGDKSYRFNIKDVDKTKADQSDINNFMTRFVDDNSALKDAKGYHKALFSAANPDAIANHFYEQGKADAMKNSVAKAKNVDMNPRQGHGPIETGGMKFKVLGDDSSDFKYKIQGNKLRMKNKNK